ncbi:MAG: AraC family transcriptional regulator [Defluviitaleaceae bacterium]|nr:AraC family transcriptional regulator [Defluviitaleaceae bacterium]
MHAWESIQKVVDYIEDNICDEIRIEELAEIANLSYFYFHRLFTRLVKKPVQEYIKLRRLACSVEDVKNKNKRILDIALEYGFSSHETFTRAFKEAYGFTPVSYRDNPVMLNSFNKPDLMLLYIMVDEGVPIISDGMVLEMNRRTLVEPICFVGVQDYVRMDWHQPDGKVTGVDEPGATWTRFHKANIKDKSGGRNMGVSFGGDAPDGYFTYFAGTEATPENESIVCDNSDFFMWQLPEGEYVVCGFEADNFEELVTNMIYKAGAFAKAWLEKHKVICQNYMPEMYFPYEDVAYMEMWFPIAENEKMEG